MWLALRLFTEVAPDIPPDDKFSPAVLIISLTFIAICLILIGIGLVIGLICAACAAVSIAFGIISTSAVLGVWRRRFSAGLRAFHYQMCAAIGLAGGSFLLWFGTNFFNSNLSTHALLITSALGGAAGGLFFAAILYWVGLFAFQRVQTAWQARLAFNRG